MRSTDGINEDRENQKGAKEFSKYDVVDVKGTFQHTISIIEKEIAKKPTFLKKEIDTGNTNSTVAALIISKTSRSRDFSEQC